MNPYRYCCCCELYSVCPVCKTCTRCHPKTQKLLGTIQALRIFHSVLQVHDVIHMACAEEMIKQGQLPSVSTTAFARPCPVRPRHGFVESRIVSDQEQLIGLIRETLAADPEGEIMITPFLQPDWNAVWTPGLLTFGSGHAGATSGQGEGQIRIPMVPVWFSDQFAYCGLTHGEVPYIEVVGSRGKSGSYFVTQIRSGPVITSTCPDHVPHELVVSQIIPVDEDLLKWERIMADAEGKLGLVVYHPRGSVTDHASVHARSRGVALVTYPVEVGQTLSPTPPSPPPDPLAVLAGVGWGDSLDLRHLNRAHLLRLMLFGLHHSSALSGADGKWIGLSAAIMLRLGSLALQGEARHEINSTTGQSFAHNKSRETVYTTHLNHSLSFHRSRVARLINTFRYGIFGSGHSCSVGGTGGMKWAACGVSLIPLFNAVRSLAISPDQAQLNSLIRALNRAVHQAHNGGWWLNKFSHETTMFTQIQQGDPLGLLPALSTIWQLHPPILGKPIARYATWPETLLRVVKPKEVEVSPLPGGVGLAARVRGVRTPISFALDWSPKHSAMVQLIEPRPGERLAFTLSNRKAGSKAQPADSTPTLLWEEPEMQKADQNICNQFNTNLKLL